MRKTTVTLLATVLLLDGCAANRAARETAIAIRASLSEHQASLDKKIAEQQNYYAKRRQAIASARRQDNDDQLDLSRRLRALEYASVAGADPNGQARIDRLLTYLQASESVDFEDYQKRRAAEAAADKEYDAALESVNRHAAAIGTARAALDRLASRTSRKERMRAAAEFAKELQKEFQKMNKENQ